MQLKWMEDEVEKSLSIPPQQILTQTIIIKAAQKPAPIIFKAYDSAGKEININGKRSFSLQPTIQGVKSVLSLGKYTRCNY